MVVSLSSWICQQPSGCRELPVRTELTHSRGSSQTPVTSEASGGCGVKELAAVVGKGKKLPSVPHHPNMFTAQKLSEPHRGFIVRSSGAKGNNLLSCPGHYCNQLPHLKLGEGSVTRHLISKQRTVLSKTLRSCPMKSQGTKTRSRIIIIKDVPVVPYHSGNYRILSQEPG